MNKKEMELLHVIIKQKDGVVGSVQDLLETVVEQYRHRHITSNQKYLRQEHVRMETIVEQPCHERHVTDREN